MKKFAFTFVLCIIGVNILAQNIKVQIDYLASINNQANSFLIKNSLYNAELFTDSLIANYGKNDTASSDFFCELAKSYFIAEEYDFVIYTVIRQKLMFPDSSILGSMNEMLYISCTKSKNRDFEIIIDELGADDVEKYNYDQLVFKVFELSLRLYSRNINEELLRVYNLYCSNLIDIEHKPLWLAMWHAMALSGSNFRQQVKYLDFSKNQLVNNNLILGDLSSIDKRKILGSK